MESITHFSLSIKNKNSSFGQLSVRDRQLVEQVNQVILSNMSNEDFDVTILAKKIFLSVSQLNRRLNQIIGCSAGTLIRKIRLKYAAELLQQRRKSISDIAYEIGYRNQANFCRSFRQEFGSPPSCFAKKARSKAI